MSSAMWVDMNHLWKMKGNSSPFPSRLIFLKYLKGCFERSSQMLLLKPAHRLGGGSEIWEASPHPREASGNEEAVEGSEL
jgi:hypothetical protein